MPALALLGARASPEQLKDCKAIMAMCKRATKQQPRMWGPSISQRAERAREAMGVERASTGE